ncbi:MAG TPA: hypothetical protein VEP90_18110 [Methylomirabilota bacterium]|nr:hypothetical protein [Methylomirabilota bacterium]
MQQQNCPPLAPNNLTFLKRISNVAGKDVSGEEIKTLSTKLVHSDAQINNIGFFGNIWCRQLNLHKKGDYHQGHRHHYDHITLVAQGGVLCEIPDLPPKIFTAPTFITIRANDWHKFTALEDNTVYYCIYAIRDKEGKVIDGNDAPIFHEKNTPYPFNQEEMLTDDEIRDKLSKVEYGCGNCGCDK